MGEGWGGGDGAFASACPPTLALPHKGGGNQTSPLRPPSHKLLTIRFIDTYLSRLSFLRPRQRSGSRLQQASQRGAVHTWQSKLASTVLVASAGSCFGSSPAGPANSTSSPSTT